MEYLQYLGTFVEFEFKFVFEEYFFFRYFLGILLNLMRGPQVEEPVVAQKEEKTPMRMLPALPATPEEPNTQIQAFGLDITKEEGQ